MDNIDKTHVFLTVLFKIKIIAFMQIASILIANYANEIIGTISLTGMAVYTWIKAYNEYKRTKK